MVLFLSINFFSWISSIFVGFFKSSLFLCHSVYSANDKWFRNINKIEQHFNSLKRFRKPVIHLRVKISWVLCSFPVKPIGLIFLMARQPLEGQGLVIVESSRSHSDIQHSVRLLWASDRPDAELCHYRHSNFGTSLLVTWKAEVGVSKNKTGLPAPTPENLKQSHRGSPERVWMKCYFWVFF